MNPEVLGFWSMAVVLVGSALAVVLSKNLFHSVLWLALALTGTAGVFLLLDAEFLAAVQILLVRRRRRHRGGLRDRRHGATGGDAPVAHQPARGARRRDRRRVHGADDHLARSGADRTAAGADGRATSPRPSARRCSRDSSCRSSCSGCCCWSG